MCEELVKDLNFNKDSEYPKLDNWTILIPSKNRLDKEITYNMLAKSGVIDRIPTYLVVEPQEYEEALAKGYKCISLDKNDQGILYARNWILRYAFENNLEHLCVIDDDINTICMIDDDPNKPGQYKRYYDKCYIEFLLATAERLDGMATIQQISFAHTNYQRIIQKEPSGIEIYSSFYQITLYNMKYMPKNFQIRDDGTNEDLMQMMQLFLEHDVKFYRITRFAYSAAAPGTNSGGMSSANIANNKYDHWHENAKKLYGDLVLPDENSPYKFKMNTVKLTKIMRKRFSKSIIDTILEGE